MSDGFSDPSTIVALVALAISIVALIGTVLQVLQQYLASAAGYSNCGEKVIGGWHKSKKRKFRWSELRFEVQFEAPVIFVCPPSNIKGPVRDAPVYHIDGTDDSMQATRARLPSDDEKASRATAEKGLHTADNEQATWVVLLQELQRMERDSQAWETTQYKHNPPRGTFTRFEDHNLCAAVQAKKRTWDTMPDGIRKPYATTTMCHLVEMAAMLGLYWQEFDRSADKYRAEGNGYVLTGTNVADLGIMFTFKICGQSRFEDNRLTPADEVKELAFGLVSTIFRDAKDKRRLIFPTEEPTDLTILKLGSANEFAETLVSFGCNTNASNVLRNNSKRHGHLFPLAFEILGMLGRTLHIPNSCFRAVPNPTFYHWDKKYFSMRKLLHEYKVKIDDDDLIRTDSDHVIKLQAMAEKVDDKLSAQKQKSGENGISLALLDVLHEALDQCDTYLQHNVRRKVVELVLREHVQEVLKMVNNEDGYQDAGDEDGDTATIPDAGSPISPGTDGGGGAADDPNRDRKRMRYNDLMTASPEEKQERLMDIYFAVLLPRVVSQAVHALKRAKATTLQIPGHGHHHHFHHGSTSSVGSAVPSRSPTPANAAAAAGADSTVTSPVLTVQVQSADDDNNNNAVVSRPTMQKHDTGITEKQATDVWVTLVFRMLCWLLLHDFHKMDVQRSKSELMGSRLPVYIA